MSLLGDGKEDDSNFIQLLKLRVNDDSRIYDYLSKKTDKYTSPTVVNEIIATMALRILRQIAAKVDKNTLRCNLRASIFQNFPGRHAPRPPRSSMLCMLNVPSTLCILYSYLYQIAVPP